MQTEPRESLIQTRLLSDVGTCQPTVMHYHHSTLLTVPAPLTTLDIFLKIGCPDKKYCLAMASHIYGMYMPLGTGTSQQTETS